MPRRSLASGEQHQPGKRDGAKSQPTAGGIGCVLALPSPRASMNSGDQGNPGSDTRYSSSANWNNVVPTLLFQSTAGRVTSPAQVAQVVLRARWWQLPSRS